MKHELLVVPYEFMTLMLPLFNWVHQRLYLFYGSAHRSGMHELPTISRLKDVASVLLELVVRLLLVCL